MLAFSWGRYGERNSQSAAAYQQEAERDQRAICPGRSGTLLAECFVEQSRAARDAYRAQQDLNAQRDMSLWAFAMFVISAITAGLTLWALWYVRGTLIATREALVDTGDATKAMLRQNEITEQSQRPWIGIDVKPRLLKLVDKAIRVELDVYCKNFGQLPATDFQLYFKLTWSDGTQPNIHHGIWDEFRPRENPTRSLVLPYDSLHMPYWSLQAIDSIKWRKPPGREYAVPLFVVSAFYKSSVTEDRWLRTDKAYYVAQLGEHWRTDATFEKGAPYDLSADDLVIEQITVSTFGD
ncbi:hypothetical protein GRI89_01025 [Altererythrobacter salegens]|uniref:Uncharacterized protein n=1 Tax=Croceibacterium salegens TaxID=1737568 RepID=A0A6I4SRA8_9SPHN|nr:hypothetical protein [Croceibacterium salegens]MXO58129.1 hypothetical protein [Croceibacterium salegens]